MASFIFLRTFHKILKHNIVLYKKMGCGKAS